MLKPQDIAKVIITELEKLAADKHWGELTLRVTLKNGDAQQLAVVTERTFRDAPPVAPPRDM